MSADLALCVQLHNQHVWFLVSGANITLYISSSLLLITISDDTFSVQCCY